MNSDFGVMVTAFKMNDILNIFYSEVSVGCLNLHTYVDALLNKS